MDWSNEEYVRLYVRETADDLELSWEALALWRALLCKFDRAGRMAARNGWTSVAALVRMPVDVVRRCGPELVKDGRIREIAGGLFAPNFTPAQSASKSDKVRQRESRDRRRHEAASQAIDTKQACHEQSQTVTSGHSQSQNVTLGLASAEPQLTDTVALLINTPPAPPPGPPGVLGELKAKTDKATGEVGAARARAHTLPESWRPRDNERELARKLGRDFEAEAEHFREHHGGKGTRHVNWDLTFRTWLRNSKKWERGGGAQSSISPTLESWARGEEQ